MPPEPRRLQSSGEICPRIPHSHFTLALVTRPPPGLDSLPYSAHSFGPDVHRLPALRSHMIYSWCRSTDLPDPGQEVPRPGSAGHTAPCSPTGAELFGGGIERTPRSQCLPNLNQWGSGARRAERGLWGRSESRALNDSTWKTRNLSASSHRGQRGGERGSSKALRKPQRQVNSDPAPGNRVQSFRSHQMPDPAPPASGMCPRCSSPAVLWEETRLRVNSASSACLCHSCPQGG